MTLTNTEIDSETQLGNEKVHIACCLADKFICGQPFHPEAKAAVDEPEDECCVRCVDLHYEALCPPVNPTHMHCPLSFFQLRVCPASDS